MILQDTDRIFQLHDPAHRAWNLLIPMQTLVEEHGGIQILEIGSMRVNTEEYAKGDGHSTLHFAQFAQDTESIFTSVDLDISCADAALEEAGLRYDVNLVQHDGLQFMQNTWNFFDFIYLDGPDDAEYTLKLFEQAERLCKSGGIIALDDCEDYEEVEHKQDAEKGRLLIPELRKRNIPVLRTGKKVVVVSEHSLRVKH